MRKVNRLNVIYTCKCNTTMFTTDNIYNTLYKILYSLVRKKQLTTVYFYPAFNTHTPFLRKVIMMIV